MANERIEKFVWSNFFVKNSKFFKIVLTSMMVLSVAAVSFFSWNWYANKDIVAKINGETITKAQLAEKKPQYERFYKHSQDTESLNNLDAVVSQKMEEDLTIITEAAKRNITLTDEEINAEYKTRQKGFSNESEFLKMIQATYGWDKEMILESVKVKLLSDKLKDVVVDGKDVEGFMVRYDYTGNKEDPIAVKAALDKINQARQDYLSGKSLQDIEAALSVDPTFGGSNSGLVELQDLNQVTSAYSFREGSEDWDVIKSTSLGQTTKVIKTKVGYYAFYKVKNIKNGKYTTWEDFLNSVRQKNKPAISVVTEKGSNFFGKISSFFGSLINSNKAQAHTGTFRACSTEPAAQWGHVYDSATGVGLSGVYVHFVAIDGAGTNDNHVHDDNGVNYPSGCYDTDTHNTSHPGGYYLIGRSYTWVDGVGVTSYGANRYIDCVYQLTKSLSKTGYVHYDENGKIANSWTAHDLRNNFTTEKDYYMTPSLTLTVHMTGNGTGHVYSPGDPRAIDCYKTSAAESICSHTYESYPATNLTSDATSGSVFAGYWAAVDTWNDQGRTIYFDINQANGDREIWAVFNAPANQAPTVTPTWPVSPTGNHTKADHAKYSYDDNTNYIYLNADGRDPNAGDKVAYEAALLKSTDGGATWVQTAFVPRPSWYGGSSIPPWEYVYNPANRVATINQGNATVASFTPASLGEGLYYWVVSVHDNGTPVQYNANPIGSTNSYNHGDPWYFEVVKPQLSVGIQTIQADGYKYESAVGGKVESVNVDSNFRSTGTTGKISCVPTCSAIYGLNNTPYLKATPNPGYKFIGWHVWDSKTYIPTQTDPWNGSENIITRIVTNAPGSASRPGLQETLYLHQFGVPSNGTETHGMAMDRSWSFLALFEVDNEPLTVALNTPEESKQTDDGTCTGGCITTSAIGGTAKVDLVATATDLDVSETKNLTISWQKDGDTTWHSGSFNLSGAANKTTLIGTLNVEGGLPAGSYWWMATAWTGNPVDGVQVTKARYLKVVDPDPVPAVSCTIQPKNGTTPFVVNASYEVVNPNGGTTTINFGEGTPITSTEATGSEYHTYKTAGTYDISITYSGAGASLGASCTASAVVKDPSDGGGGEIKP